MQNRGYRTWIGFVAGALGIAGALHSSRRAEALVPSFLNRLENTPALSVSTVPTTGTATGDQNPYGVTVAPVNSGVIKSGDILISNFNGASNLQGTGASIVRVDPLTRMQTAFFELPAPLGLTTALVALRSGVVVVGLATRIDLSGNSTPTVSNGSLLFLDGNGNVLGSSDDPFDIDGPWDMTVNDTNPARPILFVGNVLNGTVVRVVLDVVQLQATSVAIESITKIGSGFAFRTDPAALVIGPTGLAWDPATDQLFVADTGANRIAVLDGVSGATSDRGSGRTVFVGSPLAGPLGLLLTPERHLVTVNGDAIESSTPNRAVEITEAGGLVATKMLDGGAPGALFGITLTNFQNKPSLVFVDDNENTVKILKTH
jgi:hypothetical protein